MSNPLANPTHVRPGMTGTFFGKRFRVLGRIVMAMDHEGETWHWNEFHMATDAGEESTLVHEDYGDGPQWKFFSDLHPPAPLQAREAARLRVGDTVRITGTPIPVTLTGETRVVHIEGTAPAGVVVGDIAQFLNAEAPGQFLVASWTGEEIEFYRGRTLGSKSVADAFQSARSPIGSRPGADDGDPLPGSSASSSPSGIGTVVVMIAVILAVAIGAVLGFRWWFGKRSSRTPAAAPAVTLAVGDEITLGGQTFQVSGHAVVERAEVGRRAERHEFVLTLADPAATNDTPWSLLLVEPGTGSPQWLHGIPLKASPQLAPAQAASLRQGNTVEIAGTPLVVDSLFLSTGRRRTGSIPPSTSLTPGSVLYGLTAGTTGNRVQLRWDASGLALHRLVPVPPGSIHIRTNLPSGTAR